jgi:opine dehydrogenase
MFVDGSITTFSEREIMCAKITILGAGHGGQGLASFLALDGHDVYLYNRSQARIKPIRKQGGIQADGMVTGFAELTKCSTNLQEALSHAELVFLVVPASAHRDLAVQCAKFLTSEHIILLIPGRTGGALEFANILESRSGWTPTITEAQTFPLVSRAIHSGQVQITAIKKNLPIASFPSTHTREISERISKVLPSVSEATDVLETGLSNIGAVFHPAPLVLNLGRAESTKGQYNHYLEGVTPTVARFMEKIDAERVKIGRALGKFVLSAAEWLNTVYGSVGQNLYECLQTTPCYQGLGAPSSLDHRYIWEDIPTGLVPLAAIGELVGVSTPAINTIVDLASHLTGRDFWKEGRTAEWLGIDELSINELLSYVWSGSILAIPNLDIMLWPDEEMESAE